MDSLPCAMTLSTLKVRISSSPSLSFPLSCAHKNPLFSRRWKGQKAPLKNTTGWASERKRERERERERERASSTGKGERHGGLKFACVCWLRLIVWVCVCVCVCVCEYAVLDIVRGKKGENNWFWGEEWEGIEHRVTKGVKEEEGGKWMVWEREEGLCGVKVEETDRWQKAVISIPEERVIPSTQCPCPVPTAIKNPEQPVHCAEKTQYTAGWMALWPLATPRGTAETSTQVEPEGGISSASAGRQHHPNAAPQMSPLRCQCVFIGIEERASSSCCAFVCLLFFCLFFVPFPVWAFFASGHYDWVLPGGSDWFTQPAVSSHKLGTRQPVCVRVFLWLLRRCLTGY